MKNRRMRITLFAVLSALASLCLSSQVFAQDCGLLVKGGIYDYSSTSFDERQLDSFVNWFRSQRFSSLKEAQERSLTTGFVIDGVPISNAYGDSEDSFRQFKEDIESYNAGNHDLEIRLRSTLKTINARVIEHLGKCLSQHGLHAWLETTSDRNVFRITLNYNSPGLPFFATISSTPDVTNATCSRIIRRGTRISGSTLRVRCNRKSADDPVTVTINANTDIIGGGSLDLAGIPQPPPALFPSFSVDAFAVNTPAGAGDRFCAETIVPQGVSVRVRLGGSWDVYDSGNQRVATGVSVAHGQWTTRIHAYDTVSHRHLGATAFDQPVILTATNPYQVCIDVPTPPNRGYLRVHEADTIKMSVVDARTAP